MCTFSCFEQVKPLAARSAHVGLLARMGPHMVDELSALNKSLGRDSAIVLSLARIDPHVAMQLGTVFESPGANVALVWSLLRVYASVDAKVFLHRGLTAILTLVWLFTRV